jgi:hypothetical protein
MSEDWVGELQAALDDFARECLRAIVTRDMDVPQMRRLAKFCFGCINQKRELPRRVKERGLEEAVKVLRFMDEVSIALQEVVSQSESGHGNRSEAPRSGNQEDS